MTIETALEADLAEILELQKLAYQSEAELVGDPNIQPLRQTLAELVEEYRQGRVWKAVEEGRIIGSVRAHSQGEILHVGKLMVHPARRGQGIGTQLLLWVEKDWPHPVYQLFTSALSERNLALYQRQGYRPFAREQTPSGLTMIHLRKTAK